MDSKASVGEPRRGQREGPAIANGTEFERFVPIGICLRSSSMSRPGLDIRVRKG